MSTLSTPLSDIVARAGAAKPLPVLHVTNIAKSFGAKALLLGISFVPAKYTVRQKWIRKSTLVKNSLAGFHSPDQGGKLEFNGQTVDFL